MGSSWWRHWLWGKLGLVLMGRAMLRKSLIHISFDGWGCVPSLLLGLRSNYGKLNEGNSDLLQRTCVFTVVFSATDPAAGHCHPMPPLETSGHSQASLAQSLMGTLLLSPGSCCTQGFVCALQVSVSPVLWKFCNQILSSVPTGLQSQIPLGFSVPLLDPQIWKTVVGPRTFLTVWEFLWCNCFVGRLLGSSVVGLMD